MAQNRMMNLSSSQELPHLKPKAFRPSWLLPVKSIQFDLPGGEGLVTQFLMKLLKGGIECYPYLRLFPKALIE